MKRLRRAAALAAVVVTGLLAAGCTGDSRKPSDATSTSAGQSPSMSMAYDQVPQGGTLTWPIEAAIDQFNTHALDGTDRDTAYLMSALMPRLYVADATNNLTYNANYLTGEPKVATAGGRQTVTYEINPKATWSDGTPITAADFIAQWKALNGKNAAYKVAATAGYDDMTSVVQGSSPQEVIATFDKPFGEWWTVFSLLYPASTNDNPTTFNTGWIKKPLITAGPFVFASQDRNPQTYTLTPNPRWWGRAPKLNQVTFRVVAGAQATAVQDREISFLDVGLDTTTYRKVSALPGVAVHAVGGPSFRQITINGSSPTLADPRTRQAIAMGINRAAIAKAVLGQLGVTNPQPLNNHFFLPGEAGYRNNAGTVGTYNPTRAAQMLDQEGWVVQNGARVNSGQVPATASQRGKPLSIKLVIPETVPVSLSEAQLIQQQLRQINVEVDITKVNADRFFGQYVSTGAFDMAVFGYVGTAFPINGSAPTYQNLVGDSWDVNYSRVGTPQIDNLMAQAMQASDPRAAAKLANQADGAIWNEATVLPTYQRPDIWAVDSKLVNFGPFGFRSIDYTAIGFRH